ncbi:MULTISPECIES: hypothetical protein [Paenibacillus]|uniref:Lipoprotein n=1 Tax=Paenibacillus albilobatus TaxID=2716884 RepID=A0A919XCZ8_9BACL|nr:MULTISPECIES: hypothetical protein [Paenibacillus]GIO29399.1 hypothetical protein J2TS6_05400 [Paenibacillus albilobatus]
MKRYLPIMFLIICLSVSCQSKGNHIRGDEGEKTHDAKPQNISKDNGIQANREKELLLQMKIPNQNPLNISVDKIPIINSYLEPFEDKKSELNRMRINDLFTYNQKDYILLNYSCGTKLCNQLLLEHKDGEWQSLQISESSFFQVSKQNGEIAAFLFGRNEGSEVLRNQVVIVNLKKFQEIPPPENLNMLSSFEYPISMIEWNDDTLIARVTNIDDTSFTNVKEWNKKTFKRLEWKVY